MGVTAATPANLVVGAGDVYVDSSLLGASINNNLFRINRTYFTPKLNGTKGSLIGTTYIQTSEGQLECEIPEVSAAIMADLWPASQSNTSGADTTIDEDDTRRVPSADYHDWELQVPGLNGKVFHFQCDNGINLNPLEFQASDSGVMSPKAIITSTWDAADLTASPHRIVVHIPAS